jgi:ankyrin
MNRWVFKVDRSQFVELCSTEELNARRITRIVTNDFPRFFALITRLRQESYFIDERGGILASSIVPSVQAHIPEKALQKRIRVSLHVLPIQSQMLQRVYGTRLNVSPIVTIEPRRRKFHKPITVTIPLPTKTNKSGQARDSTHQQSGAYTSDSQTLRLLCSITGGIHAAQFDDITGHTPLTFSNECATFTTTVSARYWSHSAWCVRDVSFRFWLVDAQGVPDMLKVAHEIYREASAVPYMSRFVVFADDKENKTLEMQEHFTEIAKSKEIEVVNGNMIHLDLQSANLQTILKSNEPLTFIFRAFRENRLPCVVRIRDQQQEPSGRLIFARDNGKLIPLQRITSISLNNGHGPGHHPVDPQSLQPICNLHIVLPAFDRVSVSCDWSEWKWFSLALFRSWLR